jgi:hypothetical protein
MSSSKLAPDDIDPINPVGRTRSCDAALPLTSAAGDTYMRFVTFIIAFDRRSIMKRIGLIGLLSAFALSFTPLPLPAAERESAFFARAPIHAWHGQRFTVIRIDSLDEFDGFRGMLENWTSSFPDQVERLQAAIRGNHALAAALRAKGVQIRNVVAIQQGFNGGLVFYLR